MEQKRGAAATQRRQGAEDDRAQHVLLARILACKSFACQPASIPGDNRILYQLQFETLYDPFNYIHMFILMI